MATTAVVSGVSMEMANESSFYDEENVKTEIFNFIWRVIDGTAKLEQLISYLNEQKEKLKQTNQFESILADIISIIDLELGSVETNNTQILSSDVSAISMKIKKDKFYLLLNHIRQIVGDDLLMERLEVETLECLKIIPKKDTFNQKLIKTKTRLFYKQQKFNLLREESEGYSKLITELGQIKLDSRVLENIQSLIGCFNLDPNRVLDIILESFENSPLMYKTYIDLLRKYKSDDETICQIVGFKYQSLYQKQENFIKQNEADLDLFDSCDSLNKVTSYLLKYKIIDLDSLIPHLYPTDQQITQLYKEEFESARQYARKLTVFNLSENVSSNNSTRSDQMMDVDGTSSPTPHTTSSSSSSSTAAAAAAAQATANSSNNVVNGGTNQTSAAPIIVRPENQKVGLVKSLIQVNDYKTALKIIEKFPPWYLATFHDVSKSICESLNNNIIDRIYQRYNCLSKKLKEKYIANQVTNQLKRSILDDLNLDPELDANLLNIDKLSDEELFSLFIDYAMPLLCSLGPGVSFDTVLFTKLIRILISFLESKKFASASSFSTANGGVNANGVNGDQQRESTPPPVTITAPSLQSIIETSNILATLTPIETALYNQIYTVLDEVLMPSLSMISMNPCLAIELWNLLKLFPYEMRYYLYNNWRQNTYKHFPSLIRAKAECQEKIKYLLKRLSKENVKIHGRQIGKLSHDNPIIVCDYILTQIQRYDNFIVPIVDSLKFMTALSYDVLSYCIIMAISDDDRDKMKLDSTSISPWLQSVATFSALTFKKYPIELTAIIQYVINQLKNRKSFDLLILQEIVQKMCGIEVLSEVNDLQLEAMAGGDLLRQEAGYFNPIRNIKKCANRLKEALADHGLILPLCILLSQQRDFIVYSEFVEQKEKGAYSISAIEKRHLKLTGCLYDQCQDSLVQFSQFLSTTLSTEEYIHIFPKIDVLVNEYHVSPDIAFFLSRPMYAHHIQSKYEELRRVDRNVRSGDKPSKTSRYLESVDSVMQPVIDLVRTLHPAKIWEDMSPLFYTTFWTLSMSDCMVPTNAYDKQRVILKQKLTAIDENQDMTTTKKRKEKEKITAMLDKLAEEEAKQKDHVQHIRARFEREKELWFPQKNKAKNETITIFLQLCIFSRCLFTQIDAYYCAKFIQIIHSLKTPNFSTIICYDRIFTDISYSIASLTDNEARRYGRFLLGLLETVMSWHADPETFDRECSQFPGFLTVFRNALNASSASSNKQEQLDYENFRHVCHKWHYKLTKSFIVCLESDEYIQMRNSLIILTKILPHYPKITGFCTALDKRVEKIKSVEKEKRQDLYTLALVYLGQLRQRKAFMIDESKFHQKETPANSSFNSSTNAQTNASTTSSSSTSKTPNKTSGTTSSSSSSTKHSSSSSAQSSSTRQLLASGNDDRKQSNSNQNNSSSSSSSSRQNNQSSSNGTSAQNQSKQSSSSNTTSSTNNNNSSQNQTSNNSNNNSSANKSSSSSVNGSSASSSKQSSSQKSKESSSTSSSNNASSSSTNNNLNGSSSRTVITSSPPSGNSSNKFSSSKDDSRHHSQSSSGQSAQQQQQQQQQSQVNGSNSSSSSTSGGKKRLASGSPVQSPSPTEKFSSASNNNPSNNSNANSGTNSSSSSSSRNNKKSEQHHDSQSSRDNRSPSPSNHRQAVLSHKQQSPGYSPTSPVSSDELPSPSRRHQAGGQSGNNHSRSSSPKQQQQQQQQSGSSSSSSHHTRSSASSSDKNNKRQKADEPSSQQNSNGSSSNRNYQQSSGSGKSERDYIKKEHRKREHSSESNSDTHHKRSKSDDGKKKNSSQYSSSSLSSSSQSLQQQQQQQSSQQQLSSVLSSSNNNNNNNNNNNTSSNSSNYYYQQPSTVGKSSSRSSKKDSSSSSSGIKDDYQNSGNNYSSQQGNSGSKHRSSDNDRRTSHDKGSHYSSSGSKK